MLTGLISTSNISLLLVFIEGLLSFFSPCVIPLIPIYMSYLAGNTKQTLEDGTIIFTRKKVLFHTVFFILGISSAFFLLGMSFTALGSFFKENQLLFTRIGGLLIILLGLIQIGFLDIPFLQKERKLHYSPKERRINPIIAYIMGFTFSFAWTPCVGPALSSVLIMASSSRSTFLGNFLVLVYAAGFVIPFLVLGLFTTQALNFLKKHQKLLKYTVKLGGLLLILIGIMAFTGWMNSVSSYLNRFTPSTQGNTANSPSNSQSEDLSPTQASSSTSPTVAESNGDDTSEGSKDATPAYDFTLIDQYGKTHTLSDYKGKIVFLNFWATWCPPCKGEMPDIETLYNDYGQNKEDVIFLGVANPSNDQYLDNNDVSKDKVIQFLKDNDYSFPVVFDETGEILKSYNITSFPTTFMIDKDGNIFGFAPGALSKDMMISAIEQTLASTD